MTREDEPTKDRELRALLEKIAATAGDPPEHGLARLATLRRRRTRHRRGAVATTMALAVSGAAGLVWLTADHGEQDIAVEAAHDALADQPQTELPDVLEVSCSGDGIDVPVASIRPQEDGLHIEVENATDRPIDFRVQAAGVWSSGDVSIEPGESEVRQPVPPGILTVSCHLPSGEERRRVDLVDTDGLYTEPELDCVPAEQNVVEQPFRLEPPAISWVEAVREGLAEYLSEDGFTVTPLDSYPAQHFSDPTEEPMARVTRDDETMALVSLVTEDEGATWSSGVLVEACAELLDVADSDSESDGSSDDQDEGTTAPDS